MSVHTIACRKAWEVYANQAVSEIRQMSPEERTQSINQLLRASLSPNQELPWEEVQSLWQYGQMTEKELVLRAALQTQFEPLSSDELQSHFTHFFKKGRIIENLAKAEMNENQARELNLDCKGKANSVIIDELGKSLLRKGIHPQVPPVAAQQRV